MNAAGHRTWVILGGHIPLHSTRPEPVYTSRDEIILLNTGGTEARVAMTMYYADRDPVGPYQIAVGARRVRRVRCNDLIDPEAMPLGVDYAVIVESDRPIVVQFERVDSSQPALARLSGGAIPAEAWPRRCD